MKTKEELRILKEKVEALNKKLAELSEEELADVIGGKEQFTEDFIGKIKVPHYGNRDENK